MSQFNRDILVLQGKKYFTTTEWSALHTLLQRTETPEAFCQAHELVNRNRITRKPFLILREARYCQLRPFRFLINRN